LGTQRVGERGRTPNKLNDFSASCVRLALAPGAKRAQASADRAARREADGKRSCSMLTVKDIMTKKVYTVEFEASAEEAAWGLTRRQIGAAPVKNKAGELVGILTKGDLVDPEPHEWIKKEATVGDLMDPEVIAVYEDDPALVAVHELASRNQHRLVVLNTENKLVGIVSTMDVVRALDKGLSFAVDDVAARPR
jgi:CBS-domain-containing membrane protein